MHRLRSTRRRGLNGSPLTTGDARRGGLPHGRRSLVRHPQPQGLTARLRCLHVGCFSVQGLDVPREFICSTLTPGVGCSLQGPSAMRMRASSSTGLKAIVASTWLALLLGSGSLAASDDAGAVSVVLLPRHGNLALFCFSVPLLQSSTNVLRRRTLDCFCWDFFEHFVSLIQVLNIIFLLEGLARGFD